MSGALKKRTPGLTRKVLHQWVSLLVHDVVLIPPLADTTPLTPSFETDALGNNIMRAKSSNYHPADAKKHFGNDRPGNASSGRSLPNLLPLATSALQNDRLGPAFNAGTNLKEDRL